MLVLGELMLRVGSQLQLVSSSYHIHSEKVTSIFTYHTV